MRNILYSAAVAVSLLLLVAAPAGAYESNKYFKSHIGLEEDAGYMTGSWDGVRDNLAARGVTFTTAFTCDILGNTTGGRRQGTRYDHSLGWDLNFDLEKFAELVGLQFHLAGLWRTGRNLSTDNIDNRMVVSSIYGSEQFRFYSLYLEQKFFDDKFSIKAGRIAAGDDFAFSPLYWTYVSNSIDGCPISIPINIFFSVYPTATWGAIAKLQLDKDVKFMAGIYNGDPGVGRDSMYGLDFSLRLKKGIFFANELSYNPNTAKGDNGLPGHYKTGYYYHGGTFRDNYSDVNGGSYIVTGQPQEKHVGNYGLYFHIDQMVYREGAPGTDQGLIPMVVAVIAPSDINELPFFLMSGLIYKGLVPTRDNDTTAVQFIYAGWSGDIRQSQIDAGSGDPQTHEMVIEFTHKVTITKWMFLQPDIQYVIRPKGHKSVKNAFVIGTRFGLTF